MQESHISTSYCFKIKDSYKSKINPVEIEDQYSETLKELKQKCSQAGKEYSDIFNKYYQVKSIYINYETIRFNLDASFEETRRLRQIHGNIYDLEETTIEESECLHPINKRLQKLVSVKKDIEKNKDNIQATYVSILYTYETRKAFETPIIMSLEEYTYIISKIERVNKYLLDLLNEYRHQENNEYRTNLSNIIDVRKHILLKLTEKAISIVNDMQKLISS